MFQLLKSQTIRINNLNRLKNSSVIKFQTYTAIFLFIMYSKWNTEWYDLKIKLKNLDFGLPDIPKIDFNPLVSIKYTS